MKFLWNREKQPTNVIFSRIWKPSENLAKYVYFFLWNDLFYPQPIQALGYYHALHCLSICSSVCPSVCPSVHPSYIHYHPTAHNIQQILLICGTAIYLSRSMNPVDYGVSTFILWDPVALWIFFYILTDLLPGLGQRRVPVLWMVFFLSFWYPMCLNSSFTERGLPNHN